MRKLGVNGDRIIWNLCWPDILDKWQIQPSETGLVWSHTGLIQLSYKLWKISKEIIFSQMHKFYFKQYKIIWNCFQRPLRHGLFKPIKLLHNWLCSPVHTSIRPWQNFQFWYWPSSSQHINNQPKLNLPEQLLYRCGGCHC